MQTPGDFAAIFLHGRQVLWLPIWFLAHQPSSERGSKCFGLEYTPFSDEKQNNSDRIASSPESITVPFNT